MKNMIGELRRSLMAVAVLTVLLCGLYPAVAWVLAQALFPGRANGSLVAKDGAVVGSSLVGRSFVSPAYFHPRPSAAGEGYDAGRSGGPNLGPLSRELVETVRRRVETYRTENGLPAGAPVPADAVTASASGLDPHISPANALLQVPRVARVRGLDEARVRAAVRAATESRTFGILGERRVNVLRLNLALDGVPDAGR